MTDASTPLTAAQIQAIKAAAETSIFFETRETGTLRILFCEENGFMCANENTRRQYYSEYKDVRKDDLFYKLVKNDVVLPK